MTIPYLSQNSLIVHPTKPVTMIKGSPTAPTLGPQGPPMNVVKPPPTWESSGTLTLMIPPPPPQIAVTPDPSPTICVPGHQSLSLSHQSLAYYLTGVLNAW